MTAILLEFLVVFGIFWAGWFMRRWYLQHRPMREQHGSPACDVCFRSLGPEAIRTHDGHYRCAEHKTR